MPQCYLYRAYFDGSQHGAHTTAAWLLYGRSYENNPETWVKLAWAQFPVDAVSSTGAELGATVALPGFLDGFL